MISLKIAIICLAISQILLCLGFYWIAKKAFERGMERDNLIRQIMTAIKFINADMVGTGENIKQLYLKVDYFDELLRNKP